MTTVSANTAPLRVLDIFSGIGGFSLGLERAGMQTVAFCEIEPYCQAVLRKHWPDVPIYRDIRTLTGDTLARDGIAVDVICGGFPCQDLSHAGKRAGLEGARSGLWSEYARLVGELRPRFVIVENVPGLLSLGMGTVLGDLAALGYDACWDCIPASAVGAPHRRDRVWVVGHSKHDGSFGVCQNAGAIGSEQQEVLQERQFTGASFSQNELAHADRSDGIGRRSDVQMGRLGFARETAHDDDAGRVQWGAEPDVGRVAHGVPKRVDRLRALGNSVVPQIPEMIGRAILAQQKEGARNNPRLCP